MFEFFTESAILSIMRAQQEMRALGHNFVGTEGLLLGLLSVPGSIAESVITSFALDLSACRREVEAFMGRGTDSTDAPPPFTPRSKRVLELSWDEAKQLGHNYIGTEHILLGIIREGEGLAAKVLTTVCPDLKAMREAVLQRLEKAK